MRSDELYKFSDGTLQLVRDTLHDMATNLRMGYNKSMPKRIWTHLDKKRYNIMVKEIDRQLQERRLMRSLEKFVGEHQSDTKVFTMTMEILPEPTSNKLCSRSQDDDKRWYLADDLKKLKDHIQVKLKGTGSSLKSKDHYDGPEEVTRVSPITPPPLSESSSDSEFTAPVTANRTYWMPPSGSTFKWCEMFRAGCEDPPLEEDNRRFREDAATRTGVDRLSRHMDAYDVDLGFIKKHATRNYDHVLALEEDNRRLRRRLDSLEASHTLMAIDRERLEREFYSMRLKGWDKVSWRHALVIVLITMPPRRLKQRAVERLVKNQLAKAIAEYERNKANLENVGGSRPENVGGVVASDVQGCSYKTFLNSKPYQLNRIEGVVGLSRWFEKIESVFEISKGTGEDKVKFAAFTLEGHALTWWNGNGLSERVKANVTSSKPTSLHEAINMAPPAKGIGYAGSLPLCNKCRLHHFGMCPPRCGKCHRNRHHEKNCRARAPAASGNSLQNVTCSQCGEKGHYRNKCPKKDQQNKGAHQRAYVMRTEDPQ
ncbi:putative reverse transcriptase domain-containing protein [Tanacetum coccineum]